MKKAHHTALLVSLTLSVVAQGCGSKQEEVATPPATSTAQGQTAAAADAKPQPYSYPAPAKGHYKEVNTGDFDLTDGIAYPAGKTGETIVWLTAKPVASPLLANSECPMTEARALANLRDSPWLEVSLNPSGRSAYFAAGTPFGGSSREEEVGGGYWQGTAKISDHRIAGSIDYKNRGGAEFDLLISQPKIMQVSQNDWMQGRHSEEAARLPAAAEVKALYQALHTAALAKDLKGILAAQGFSTEQIAAIRGLAGIDTDLVAFADRFLNPGTAEGPSSDPGYERGIMARGANSKGENYANWYEFSTCGKRLLLTSIGLNPQ